MDRERIGQLLRRARGRLTPAEVGLPAGDRRRVQGLRREEVAALAGVSVDYVIRLEQGRGSRPSTGVLTALARALRLSDAERQELFDLVGAPPPRPGQIPMLVRASILQLLDRLEDNPAVIISAKGDILAWNPLAAALLGDFSAIPEADRNLAWLRFGAPFGRRVDPVDPDDETRTDVQAVASLRGACSRYPRDEGLQILLHRLKQHSPAFVRLWEDSTAKPWRSHTKSIRHPDLGDLTLDCDTLHLPEEDQALIIYSAPPGSASYDALRLLKVLGLQRFSEADV